VRRPPSLTLEIFVAVFPSASEKEMGIVTRSLDRAVVPSFLIYTSVSVSVTA
jgi:hypothetical protein